MSSFLCHDARDFHTILSKLFRVAKTSKLDTKAATLQSWQTWAIVVGTFLAGIYGLYEMIKAICKYF